MSAEPLALLVRETSQVSAARLGVQRLAHALDFDELRTGQLSILASEAVSNMVKHAGGGTFTATRLERDGVLGIEMLAIDAGPGMDDFVDSSTDGVSTTGTQGTGLGAMRRLADEFDVRTWTGEGTMLRMVLWQRDTAPAQSAYEIGSILVPKEGETVCGDSWTFEQQGGAALLLVADGLGHGPEAHRASASAIDVARRHPGHGAIRLMDLVHSRLRPTRGAAVAAMRREPGSDTVSFVGVGNIGAWVLADGSRRAMVSHNGIVGHAVHKSQAYEYPWPVGGLLVAHSDGLETQWDLADLPGIMAAPPAFIAAALYRRHWRKRDDVVVVVVRRKE